jgi:hypothetical protein
MEERNDIVIYKSEDGLVKMEAMVDPANETIWANQKAIAALFGVTVPNISYHLGRIFKVASQFVCLGPGLQFKERPKLRLFLSTYADTLFGTGC